MSLANAIKSEALRLGFQIAGVTTPDPPEHFSTFVDWLSAGHHGEMGYLATARSRLCRSDPTAILPGCRSILVLGMRYPSPLSPGELKKPGKFLGRVSSYAWGDDYHTVLARRLRALVTFIEQEVGHPVPNRWYTDTGPLLERDLAQRAGLGWIGKNTCLIHPRLGSYFFLAEALLALDLDPDPPFLPDRCGTCTRCLEACPTACILPDRTLEARRCISYLTIELRGSIPVDLRPQMGNWIFGCDICQEVCPWNRRFAGVRQDHNLQIAPAFTARPNGSAPDLLDEMALSPQEFNRKFKDSPFRRSKRGGYLRNVAVALGSLAAGQGEVSVVDSLATSLLNDQEPIVRGHAAWALRRVGGEAAHRALVESAEKEQEAFVLSEIYTALGVSSVGGT